MLKLVSRDAFRTPIQTAPACRAWTQRFRGSLAALASLLLAPLALPAAVAGTPPRVPGTHVEAGVLHLEIDTRVPGQRVTWVSNANDWDEDRTPLIETRPGFYELNVPEPWVPTLAYKFVVDGKWGADPTNPRREADGVGGWNSLIELSFQEDPLLDDSPGVDYLQQTFTFKGRGRASRTVTVLRPKSNSLARESVVLYFQDGGDYLERASVRQLLSHLALDPQLPPFSAVLVPPADRMKEYGLTAATIEYSRFIRSELVPRVEAATGIGGDRAHRAMIGPSLGGLVTLYLAVDLQDLFATAISQSGSIWYKGEVITRFLDTAPVADTRLFLTVGAFETPTMVRTNRMLAEHLRARNDVNFEYREYPNVHDWRGWRNQLSEIFYRLFSRN